ncbi:MAG: hypothetical protein AAF385_03990 [Pseudomonadota bacterium]
MAILRPTIIAVFSLLIVPHLAAQSLDEIVVTGSRVGSFANDSVPVIHIKRHADFLVLNTYIESDSRDAKLRSKEVRETLEALFKRAKTAKQIELGLIKSFETDNEEFEYIVPFTLDAAELSGGYRADTSRVSFVVKSPIQASDTSPEAVLERIEAFTESVKVSGRAVVADSGDVNLSLVNIAQYRMPLLKMIAEDSKRVSEIFGDDYAVNVAGVDEQVRWKVVGPMQIAIYFPYLSSVYPK